MEEEEKTCYRCGNKLALGMSIVHIGTFLGQDSYNLCGACTQYLKSWLKRRVDKPA